MSQLKEKLLQVPLTQVRRSPYQPRLDFDGLEELAASIRAVGLLQPPVVRALGDGVFELIAGERRLRASELAGLEEIPVIVREGGEAQVAHAALVENIQRVDLDPLEVARALHSLGERFGLSQAQLAERVGKKRSTVANYLRLLALPEKAQAALQVGKITMGHAKVVLSVDERERAPLLKKMLDEGWTVRQAEAQGRCSATVDLERRLERQLGMSVRLRSGRGDSGSLTLNYGDLDELDQLLERLGVPID